MLVLWFYKMFTFGKTYGSSLYYFTIFWLSLKLFPNKKLKSETQRLI